VAAGAPIEEIASGETVAVPSDFVRRAGSHYVLRVRGNSMIDDQIRDGDFVVVHDRAAAENGEMVIAMLDGASATVKRFYRERDGRIRLQPSNEQMTPTYVREDQLHVRGIVVGVLRRY
jgi:repressor LexA